MIEAACARCGEHYNPASMDPDDLEHWSRADGSVCGGRPSMIWTGGPSPATVPRSFHRFDPRAEQD